ncbi:MAG: hypothetical protein SGJ02_00785 [bacterium]|nr:hypothetical protein [bacterium]
MNLTKIDCSIVGSSSGLGDTELYSVFNPLQRAGCLVAGFASGSSNSVSGQISSRLALEHFSAAVSQHLISKTNTANIDDTFLLEALELAFKEANRSVYEFGHKLAAGGRMGTSLLGIAICNGNIGVAKSDSGSVYIVRNEEVVPFFVEEDRGNSSSSKNYVGANSLVNVELSSLPLEASDTIIAFSRTLEPNEEIRLIDFILAGFLNNGAGLKHLTKQLFSGSDLEPSVLSVIVGPEGIYLKEAV